MSAIDMLILKSLYYINLVNQHKTKQQHHHKDVQAMLCFTHFYYYDIKQDSATTIAHIKSIIELLNQRKIISATLSALWETHRCF